MKYKIKTKEAGIRLDRYLSEKLVDYSRSSLQKIIKSGNVEVNGKPVPVHYFLKDGDVVVMVKHKPAAAPKVRLAKDTLKPQAVPFNWGKRIIEDNDEYLVIDKPAGIAVHGQSELPTGPLLEADNKQKEVSLSDLVIKKYPKIAKVGDDPIRPGIVHRLDKEVSGLMVIAKTNGAFDNLKQQFMDRAVKKTYLALVYGKIEKDEGTIDFPIERSREGKMAARPANQPGKPAITDFSVKKRFINYTLIEARPKTGRTHQIRAHLAAYGTPIVGDNLYGTKDTRAKNKKFDLGRIFLAAGRLEFKNSAGETQIFELPLPNNLKDLLNSIK